MDIYLDDEPVTVAEAETCTIDELTQRMRQRLDDPARLITTIRCDGRTVEPEELEGALREPATRFGRIEFQSSNLRDLVVDALEGATVLIEESDETRRRAADLLCGGQTADAMHALGACFAAWSQAHETAVQCAAILHVNLDEAQVGDEGLSAWAESLKDKLGELKGALEVNDHVLVSDILRYEFDEVSNGWRRLLTHLREQAPA